MRVKALETSPFLDRTVSIRIGRLAEHDAKDVVDMFIRRKEVFADTFKWDLPFHRGALLEVDQFDVESAIYVVARRNGIIRSSARLLRREESMVAEIWPELMTHVPEDAVEISRYCVHGVSDVRFNRTANTLMHMALAETGVTKYFGIADPAILRSYRTAQKWPPDSVNTHPDYPRIYLVNWRV